MSRMYISWRILLLLCPGFLCVLALSQSVLAYAHVEPHVAEAPGQTSPNPVVDASIQAPNNIWYTGVGTTANNYVLIQYWNGKTFQVPAGIPANSYIPSETGQAVVSLSPTDSWVIANGLTDENPLQIFHFDGTSRQTFPSPPVKGARVNAVAAVNADDIWAVGSSGPLVHNFTMHWDGTSWQAVDTPDPLPRQDTNILYDVDARAANDVWAVGTQQDPNGGDSPFALHWDGKTWSIKSPPDTDDPHHRPAIKSPASHMIGHLPQVMGRAVDFLDLPAAYYRAVAAVSTNNVWAAGTGGVIEHWDGKQWHVVVAPASATTVVLSAISAYSANDIWAVGQQTVCTVFGGCSPVTFTEHWNGSMWCVVPSPSLSLPDGSRIGAFIAVKMFASNNVWAVGTAPGYVFLEHWDGHNWRVVAQRNLFV